MTAAVREIRLREGQQYVETFRRDGFWRLFMGAKCLSRAHACPWLGRNKFVPLSRSYPSVGCLDDCNARAALCDMGPAL